MSAVTPGPWFIAAQDDADDKFEIVGDQGVSVAFISRQYPQHDGVRVIAPEMANARLIAAAPETAKQRDELLAVLKEVLPVLELAEQNANRISGPNVLNSKVQRARAAIASATGGKVS